MAPILARKERVLVILGGSRDQVAAVREAKRLGLATLVVDSNKNCLGFKISDYKLATSTRDPFSIGHKLKRFERLDRKIVGFFVQGTDIPQVGAFLSKKFDVLGLDESVANISVDKYKMKKFLKLNKLPVPEFLPINNYDDFERAPAYLGYPFILKPVDRSGARGVIKINNKGDINAKNFNCVHNQSISKRMIAEEFIAGAQFSTESIIIDGFSHTVIVAERNYEFIERYSPFIIENGGWSDNLLNRDQKINIENLLQQLTVSLGIQRGFIKGDLVIGANGIVIIEFALRVSGGDLAESLIPIGTGLNYLSLAIRNTIGDKISNSELLPQKSLCVANRYFFPEDGKLHFKKNKIKKVPDYVKKLEFWAKQGQICKMPTSHADRIGVFILVGSSRQDVKEKCSEIYSFFSPEFRKIN